MVLAILGLGLVLALAALVLVPRLLRPFALLTTTLSPALRLVVALLFAIEALDFLLLGLLVGFCGGGKSFVLRLVLLPKDMFFILTCGCTNNSGGGDVHVVDVTRGGEGVTVTVIAGR